MRSRRDCFAAATAAASHFASAFGAFFPTDTKVTTHRPPLDLLTEWQETVEVPCVAIGGITVDNAAALARAGADFVKTSTGFHPSGGASPRAVELMAGAVDGRLGVKASGGIRSAADAIAMLDAGAAHERSVGRITDDV